MGKNRILRKKELRSLLDGGLFSTSSSRTSMPVSNSTKKVRVSTAIIILAGHLHFDQ